MREPKVYFDRGWQMLLGPLGYWRVGDEIPLNGTTYHVGSVDLDGGAVSWSTEYLEGLAKREPHRGSTVAAVLKSLENVHTGKSPLELTPTQIEQCKRIAAVGERLRESE